ncbi:MAG: alanine racemase, partial [Bacilli bacterium]|nr:alanine racemase [Bacilli bacterium]
MYRKTYVEINCDKLENNIKKIIKTYNGYKYYFGVVKNNAYNHGIECIKYMIKSGINYLCVATLEEALEIRKIDKNIPILVLEPIELNAIKDAFSNDITITIDDRNQFDKLLKSKLKG